MENKEEQKISVLVNAIHKSPTDWKQILASIVSAFDCTTGTLHFLETGSSILRLETVMGIPDFIIPKLSEIPVGKGMAGIAAERREPVEMCNLQTDDSGVARPSAKETKVEGSIVVPLLLNDTLYGTLGIAKPVPYDFTENEKLELLTLGKEISAVLLNIA